MIATRKGMDELVCELLDLIFIKISRGHQRKALQKQRKVIALGEGGGGGRWEGGEGEACN